jgi:hypothetical protein
MKKRRLKQEIEEKKSMRRNRLEMRVHKRRSDILVKRPSQEKVETTTTSVD